MAKLERFEDIETWQKAWELTNAVYAISNEGKFARGFGLRLKDLHQRQKSRNMEREEGLIMSTNHNLCARLISYEPAHNRRITV